jgi:AraC-like DNA-binding protein
MTTWRVPEPLRRYVAAGVGYRDRLDPQAVHHGLPSPHATVILAFDDPLDVGWVDTDQGHGQFWMLASGLHDMPALIRTHGRQHGVQLSLTPLGVRALLGVPAGEISRLLVDHADLPLGLDHAAYDAVAGAPDWPSRFAALERHLLGVLARRSRDPLDGVRPEVAESWRLLRTSRGRRRVEDVASSVGWSRRYLAPRFAAEFGVGPKQAARVMRFSHARALAERGTPLADAAARAGYADQAHLSREWRAMAARTPTQWLRDPYHLDDAASA